MDFRDLKNPFTPQRVCRAYLRYYKKLLSKIAHPLVFDHMPVLHILRTYKLGNNTMNTNPSNFLRKAFLAVILLSAAPATASDVFGNYLAEVEQQFDRAQTALAKFSALALPINLDYLSRVQNYADAESDRLFANDELKPLAYPIRGNKDKLLMECEQSNPFMLAISTGNLDLVRKFLSAIPNVNDTRLCAWGYRQPYTVGHMLLDPNFPKIDVPIQQRLAMVDLLASRNVDFNMVFGGHYYTNPALAAGCPSGRPVRNYEMLQARALLYGADPTFIGSSFTLVSLREYKGRPKGSFISSTLNLLKVAFDDYINLLNEEQSKSITAEIQSLRAEMDLVKNKGLKRHRTTRKEHLWRLISDAEERLKNVAKQTNQQVMKQGSNKFTLTPRVREHFATLAAQNTKH